MSETMCQRTGGLVDRQVYFLPFSRKISINDSVVSQIEALRKSCLEQRGVLLAQPEHILSFKLMGIERLLSGELSVASRLMTSQSWLESYARDTLDESDELLDVKFQLIYTLGSQRLMDGQPDRWLITRAIFDLVEKHAAIIQTENPGYVEMTYKSKSSFPQLRILSAKIGALLISRVAQEVIDSGIPGLNLGHFSQEAKTIILRFLFNKEVSDEDCRSLQGIFGSQENYKQKLLLIRGLFAYKIILFVLRSKRWSVNYGLHPSRCLTAVPYRAKGVPAPSAEFGHPDVAIALICLSYYYSGLSDLQIRTSLTLLQRSDDPSLEYSSWISQCDNMPHYLLSWSAVNLEDDRQFYEELFPNLRFGKKVADYYMTNVVFPKEGKEFEEKLSTSGWDIISCGPQVTTGFSGTNDNRFVLPLSISQQDLPELKQTSGMVLDFVLREENLTYHCMRDARGRQMSTKRLIRYITELDSNIQVIIDVGAQILDTSNCDFVKAWLGQNLKFDAGIFFDEDDTVMVISRDSRLEKLSTSSFQNRMDRCVVYLDEVHTRGTDLRLAQTVRAAVTLGPRLTKDRLVQACMRLRKLAQGQSLTFLAPLEVHRKIAALANGKDEDKISGYDVIAWSLEQSCVQIERSQPLRILQGLGYTRRLNIMRNFCEAHPDLSDLDQADPAEDLIKAFREKEEQRLLDLYAPTPLKTSTNLAIVDANQQSSDPLVQTLIALWGGLKSDASTSASIHEEHEREVAHEVEQQTQVETTQSPASRAYSRYSPQ